MPAEPEPGGVEATPELSGCAVLGAVAGCDVRVLPEVDPSVVTPPIPPLPSLLAPPEAPPPPGVDAVEPDEWPGRLGWVLWLGVTH